MAPMNASALTLAAQTWVTNNGIANAALVVSLDGNEVATWARDWTVDTPAPIASTSKAITAQCIMGLIDARRLTFDNTVQQMLTTFTATIDAPMRPNAGRITVAHLLRHTSGLGDPTQQQFPAGAGAANPAEWFALRAFNVALMSDPGTRHFYSNVNYAILGLMIESITGQTYETWCLNTVLRTSGAGNARLGAGVRAMGAFGGWEMTAREYSRFYRRSFVQSSLSAAARAFMDGVCPTCDQDCSLGIYHKANFTMVPMFRTPQGVFHVPVGNMKDDFHHHGDWNCVAGTSCNGATTPQQFASYAATWGNGLTAFVVYDRHVNDNARRNLADVLNVAAYDVSRAGAGPSPGPEAPPSPPPAATAPPPAVAPTPPPAPQPKAPSDPSEVLRELGR